MRRACGSACTTRNPTGTTPTTAPKTTRYQAYLHGQVGELLTNYGQVDIIWFDGLGGSAKDWDAGGCFP